MYTGNETQIMSDRKLISVPWNLAEITISKCRYFQPEKDLTLLCVLIRKNHGPPGGNLIIDVLTKQSYSKCKFKSKSVKYRLLNDTGPFHSCVTVAGICILQSPLPNFLHWHRQSEIISPDRNLNGFYCTNSLLLRNNAERTRFGGI